MIVLLGKFERKYSRLWIPGRVALQRRAGHWYLTRPFGTLSILLGTKVVGARKEFKKYLGIQRQTIFIWYAKTYGGWR